MALNPALGFGGHLATWHPKSASPSPASPGCPVPATQLAPRGRVGIRLGRCGQRIPGLGWTDGLGEGLSHTPSPLLAWLLGPSQPSWGGGQAGGPREACWGDRQSVPRLWGRLWGELHCPGPREEPGWAQSTRLLCVVSMP